MKTIGRIGCCVVVGAAMVTFSSGPANADLDRGIVRITGSDQGVTVDYVASPTEEVQRSLSIFGQVRATATTFVVESRFVEATGTCAVSNKRASGQVYEVTCPTAPKLDVHLGDRRDDFEVRTWAAIDATIASGAGDDSVKVRALHSGVIATIDTGAGNDVALFSEHGIDVTGAADIAGGSGRDRINHDGSGTVNSGPGEDFVDVHNKVANRVDCANEDRVRADKDIDTLTECVESLVD